MIRRYIMTTIIGLLLLTACKEKGISMDEMNQTVVSDEASVSQQDQNAKQSDTSLDLVEENQFKENHLELSFNKQPGIYPEPFFLEITAKKGEIIYTLDGTDPRVSDTASLYEAAIRIEDRKGQAIVVSAVEPVLISGNFNKPNDSRDGFVSSISAPIDSAVDQNTIVRAVIKDEDGSFSAIYNGTYFIGTTTEHVLGLRESIEAAGHTLAVMSITMNYDDLFDAHKGIYVKGTVFDDALTAYLKENSLTEGETARRLDANYKQKGKMWERNAFIELFEFDIDSAELVLAQDCGIRIQGNYSRSDLQKGFRIIADKDYGDNNFRYPVFGEGLIDAAGETMDKFKSLVLRAGGNCTFTAKFNDTYWQTLMRDFSCDTKASRPCVVYLNGEYWGLYVLEEDYSDDYYEDHYLIEKDDVVIYKGDAEAIEIGYKLDEGDLPEGIKDVSYYYHDLLAFFDTHSDLVSDEAYEAFQQLVDTESVMDYFAAQVWINNKWDWPGKNWSMWKTITVEPDNPYWDGRWRFSFYDMDFGGVSGEGEAKVNTIKEDNYKPYGLLDMDTDNPAVLCFAYLMTNETFRIAYLNQLASLSDTIFKKEKALYVLDEFESIYGPLYPQFFERYPETGSAYDAAHGGYASSGAIRAFLMKRQDHIQTMVDWVEDHYN